VKEMSDNKTCTRCGEEKPATLEYFHKREGEALRADCKVCRIQSAKAHYIANKEAISEYGKAYYEANREAVIEKSKARYEANREAVIERVTAYREANREAINEQKKAYYRTPKGKFRSVKSEAKRRGINFSLLFELYETQLWGKPCHYCGCEIEVTGLDRKDSGKGYSRDNVVPCCYDCNSKKKDKPYDQFVLEQNISEAHNK
jgi:hypothetical protein